MILILIFAVLGVILVGGLVWLLVRRFYRIKAGLPVFVLFRKQVQCPLCARYFIVLRRQTSAQCPFCKHIMGVV